MADDWEREVLAAMSGAHPNVASQIAAALIAQTRVLLRELRGEAPEGWRPTTWQDQEGNSVFDVGPNEFHVTLTGRNLPGVWPTLAEAAAAVAAARRGE